MAVTLNIPIPPSANQLTLTRRGRRINTPMYKAWLFNVGQSIQIQMAVQKPMMGTVAIEYAIPGKSRIDLDNHIKPLNDALWKSGVIQGDDKRYVRAVYAYFSPDLEEVQAQITRRT